MKETQFKQTEIGLVPQEWRVVRLGKVCKIGKGKGYSKDNLCKVGNPIVLYGRLYTKYEAIINDIDTFVTPYPNSLYSKGGEVIIPGSGETAEDIARASVILNPYVIIGGDLNVLYPSKDLSSAYLALCITCNKEVNSSLVSRAQGKTVVHLHGDDLAKTVISLPPLSEQSRIAGALSSVDGLLSSLSRLIDKKRALRTAAMQQLLNAKTRLPGFNEPWKEVRLGECFDIGNGYTPSKANPAYWTNGTIPWFRMEDIRANGRILSDSIQHITPQAVKGAGLFPKGSIILSTTATIGEHALLIADSLANQRFSFLVRKLNRAEAIHTMYFFYQCFALGDWCRANINEGGLAAVCIEDLKNYEFSLPSLPEQRAIASVLSSMDSELSALEAKRTKVEALRAGMMQQLLTGRIRLTEGDSERK